MEQWGVALLGTPADAHLDIKLCFFKHLDIDKNVFGAKILIFSSPQEKQNHNHLHRRHSECHHDHHQNNDNDGHIITFGVRQPSTRMAGLRH